MTEFPGYWLGQIGGMVALPDYAGAFPHEPSNGVSFDPLIGGSRFAWVDSTAHLRSWQVDIPSCDPDEVAPLRELLAGDPLGNWWWVTPQARATNILTPRMCDFPALVPGGMRPTVEGDSVVRSWLVGPGNVVRTGPVPVVAGLPVTGSAWLQGGTDARVGLEFLDLAGNVVGMRSTLLNPNKGAMERVHVTADVPAGAVSANLYVTQPVAFARPAVSWTTGPTEWEPGLGARSVHASHPSIQPTRSVFRPEVKLRMQDISFTVTELADA